MKIRKKILLIATCLFMLNSAKGQALNQSQFGQFPAPATGSSYSTAIGLRAGETSGLTVKHFIGGNAAIEGIFGFWHHGFTITGLYEIHANAFGAAGLNWYYGGGAHFSIHTHNSYYGFGNRRNKYYDTDNFGLGIDGIVGLEYKIPQIPIAISLDFKPYIEVISNGNLYGSLDPGLGIKVAF